MSVSIILCAAAHLLGVHRCSRAAAASFFLGAVLMEPTAGSTDPGKKLKPSSRS
jgi:hypothetical protein